MKKSVSLSILSLKLALVACFSFVGGTVISAEAMASNCHEYTNGEEINNMGQEKGNSDACKTAENAWSAEFVFQTPQITFEENSSPPVSNFENREGNAFVFLEEIHFSSPPDGVTVWDAHLIAKSTTVLVI